MKLIKEVTLTQLNYADITKVTIETNATFLQFNIDTEHLAVVFKKRDIKTSDYTPISVAFGTMLSNELIDALKTYFDKRKKEMKQ